LDIIPLPAEEGTPEDKSPLDFTQYESPVDTKDPTTDEEEPEPDSDEEMADITTNNVKELNLDKPSPFTGDRTKTDKFIQQCKLYLKINKKAYDDEEKQVRFIFSLMSRGEAGEWSEQYLKVLTDAQGEINLPTLKTMLAKIAADFKQEDQVGNAMERLRNLKQGNQTIKELVTKFRLLVGQAGLDSTSISGQRHLIEMFIDSLNDGIGAKLMYSESVPSTLNDWYKRAIQVDVNKQRADARFGKKNPPTNRQNYEGRRNWNFE